MKCPFCKTNRDRVVDSRASDDGTAIRRRRECVRCNRRYTTVERVVAATLKVIKKDGARVPFSREKLRLGIERACWKRPISTAQLEKTIADIEQIVYDDYESEVETRRLGDVVLEHLQELDPVAFIRFASVYRQFDDLQDFVETLTPILEDQQDEDLATAKADQA